VHNPQIIDGRLRIKVVRPCHASDREAYISLSRVSIPFPIIASDKDIYGVGKTRYLLKTDAWRSEGIGQRKRLHFCEITA
jgi:hypothetical protein